MVLARQQPAPRVADARPEHRQRPGLLTARAAAIRVLVERRAHVRVPQTAIRAVLGGNPLRPVQVDEIEVPLSHTAAAVIALSTLISFSARSLMKIGRAHV